MQVIITRAAEQADSLQMICHELAFKPVLLPCVQIQPDIKNNTFTQAIAKFAETDIVIVVSANAAKMAVPLWPKGESGPTIMAIGPATAEQITACGGEVDVVADPPSSEGLLTSPLLQADAIAEKNITIFCGRHPKPLLQQVLQERGAQVHQAFCYQRICPVPLSDEAWKSKVHMLEPLVVVSTSIALLENLVFITPTHYLRLLESMPLLVISDGMRQRAEQLGFTRIIQAENATVEAIKNALVTFLAR